jgi:hypothetical protein
VEFFASHGLSVLGNRRFAGRFVPRGIGREETWVWSVMVEVNGRLCWREEVGEVDPEGGRRMREILGEAFVLVDALTREEMVMPGVADGRAVGPRCLLRMTIREPGPTRSTIGNRTTLRTRIPRGFSGIRPRGADGIARSLRGRGGRRRSGLVVMSEPLAGR